MTEAGGELRLRLSAVKDTRQPHATLSLNSHVNFAHSFSLWLGSNSTSTTLSVQLSHSTIEAWTLVRQTCRTGRSLRHLIEHQHQTYGRMRIILLFYLTFLVQSRMLKASMPSMNSFPYLLSHHLFFPTSRRLNLQRRDWNTTSLTQNCMRTIMSS